MTAVDPEIDVERFKDNPTIRAIDGTLEEIPRGELFDVITLNIGNGLNVITRIGNNFTELHPFEHLTI